MSSPEREGRGLESSGERQRVKEPERAR